MVLDPNTLKALGNYVEEVGSVESVIETYQNARQKYYEGLSTFDTFGRGMDTKS